MIAHAAPIVTAGFVQSPTWSWLSGQWWFIATLLVIGLALMEVASVEDHRG